jgi:hypothetical protein
MMDLIETLKAVVLDPEATGVLKQRATESLAYIARTEKRLAQLPEIDRVVAQKLARIIGRERSLWEHPDQYEIYTDSEGVERIRQKTVEPIESGVITTPTVKSSGPEVELQQEPEPEESALTGEQKLQRAREQTRGMLPSLNF